MKKQSIEVPWAKSKLRQLLCDHDPEWYEVRNGPFFNLSGERRYKVCKKCGKVLDTYFHRYD